MAATTRSADRRQAREQAGGPRSGPARRLYAVAVVLTLAVVGLNGDQATRTAAKDEPAKRAKQAAPRTDRHGDPLPPGAVARLGTLRYRFAGWPMALACSPDGRWLATHDGEVICLLEAATGKRVREYRGHRSLILCLAYSPDGKAIASGASDNTFRVWDIASGRERCHVQGGPAKRPTGYAAFAHVFFSPDGKALVTHGEDNLVRLWDIATGRELRRFTGYLDLVWTVALARDGKTLAALVTPPGADPMKAPYEARVWEVATGKQIHQWPVPGDLSIWAFSPDLDVLVTRPPNRPPYLLTVWDMATGKPLRTLPESSPRFTFSADGKALVTVGETLCFWDVVTGKERRRVKLARPLNFAGHIALMPDGRTLVSWGWRHVIQFHDTLTGKELRHVEGPDWAVRAVAFLPDGKRLASGGTAEVRLWDVSNQRELQRFNLKQGQSGWVTGLACFPDGKRLLASTANGGLHLWDVAGGPEARGIIRGNSDDGMVLSPDGKAFVTWRHNEPLSLWDAHSWKPVREWPMDKKWVEAVVFSPDGKTLTASVAGDGQKALLNWDVATGGPLPGFGKPARVANALAYSADGRLLAAVEWFGTVRLWETATRGQRAVAHMADNARGIAFSPDGRFLVTANGGGFRRASKDGTTGNENYGKICLVDVATLKVVRRLAGHFGGVTSLAFSPDGKLLASGGQDTTVLVWDMAAVTSGVIPPAAPPAPVELEALWADLAGDDGVKAHRAIWTFARTSKQSLPFLKARLRPAVDPDAQQVARLLADLDSARGKVRDAASRQLARMGERAGPALHEALARPGSLEFRRRIELLLAKLDGVVRLPEERRALRATEALEHMATPEARALLRELVGGAPGMRLTHEARAALERLRKRNPAAP